MILTPFLYQISTRNVDNCDQKLEWKSNQSGSSAWIVSSCEGWTVENWRCWSMCKRKRPKRNLTSGSPTNRISEVSIGRLGSSNAVVEVAVVHDEVLHGWNGGVLIGVGVTWHLMLNQPPFLCALSIHLERGGQKKALFRLCSADFFWLLSTRPEHKILNEHSTATALEW